MIKKILNTRDQWLRAGFWAALVFTFLVATWPKGELLHTQVWDKLQHFAAFFTLAALASGGYPALQRWRIGAGLSLFGGLIELVQAIPALHRDSDVRDWIADSLAIVLAMALLALWRGLRTAHRP